MAEQRLQLEGIPCFVRCLRGGAGLWGSVYNLPHDLMVFEDDLMTARDILDVAPAEIQERERLGQEPSAPMPQWVVTVMIVAIVAFIAFAVVIANRAVG